MKLSTCCHALLLPVTVEFKEDYPLKCSICGRFFEEGDHFWYSFTSDLLRLRGAVNE